MSKKHISLCAEPRKTALVVLLFTAVSLFLLITLLISTNNDCMQLNSLIRSSYDYSVTMQKSVLENDYYQFNAGIDFALSVDSQTSLNADILMQTDKSVYTDLVYWNADKLSAHGVAITNNIAKAHNIHSEDKLYSKHVVNGKICEYTIEQILPETICIRADKGMRYSNGIIIMGYDAEYVEHITYNFIVFTNDTIDKLTAMYSDTPQQIVYRHDEIRSAVLNIVPYVVVILIISIATAIILVWVLSKEISCNFRRLVMLGFEKKKLNTVYYSYIYKSGIISILTALALSNIVFLFVNFTVVKVILVISIPLIELITLFITAAISNRRLWRK